MVFKLWHGQDRKKWINIHTKYYVLLLVVKVYSMDFSFWIFHEIHLSNEWLMYMKLYNLRLWKKGTFSIIIKKEETIYIDWVSYFMNDWRIFFVVRMELIQLVILVLFYSWIYLARQFLINLSGWILNLFHTGFKKSTTLHNNNPLNQMKLVF